MNKREKRSSRRCLLILLVFVMAVTAFFAGCQEEPKDLKLELKGDAVVSLEYGAQYSEAGTQVIFNGQSVDAEVTVEMPPMDQLGTHIVVYSVTYEGVTASAQRTVHIVDTQPPVITLQTNPDSFTEIGAEYVEEGFTAMDNHDGDITHKVERIVENGVVTYTVKDSSGNTVRVTRNIVYGDRTPPVLTLQGDNTVTIMAGTKFKDPGFTAVDNSDGDISHLVKVTGSYDMYLPGTYQFHYTVTDSYGNSASVTRVLIVKGAVQPEQITPGGKVIYLTFDDGPGKHTPRLLEILKKYNVKATFFVVGTASTQYYDDIVKGGHAIGIHTNTHEFSEVYASEDAFFADFFAVHEKIYQYTGVKTTLCRFPGGSSNKVSIKYCEGIMTRLTKAVEALGFQYFDWHVDSGDAGEAVKKLATDKEKTEFVYNNVINGIKGKNTAVVLQHDIRGFSVDAVEKIIQWGLANGYTFQMLDETSPTAHHKINN